MSAPQQALFFVVMKVIVNGGEHEHRGDGSLTALLSELGAKPGQVAVIVNGEVIARHQHDHTRLKEGDRVELLTFMGGG